MIFPGRAILRPAETLHRNRQRYRQEDGSPLNFQGADIFLHRLRKMVPPFRWHHWR